MRFSKVGAVLVAVSEKKSWKFLGKTKERCQFTRVYSDIGTPSVLPVGIEKTIAGLKRLTRLWNA